MQCYRRTGVHTWDHTALPPPSFFHSYRGIMFYTLPNFRWYRLPYNLSSPPNLFGLALWCILDVAFYRFIRLHCSLLYWGGGVMFWLFRVYIDGVLMLFSLLSEWVFAWYNRLDFWDKLIMWEFSLAIIWINTIFDRTSALYALACGIRTIIFQ